MTTIQISTLTSMRKQTMYNFISIALSLISVITSCSYNDNKTTISTTSDTTKVQTPKQPKVDTISTFKKDITTNFTSPTNEIKVNKKASSPFNKLDYNKVIAYDYQGGKGKGVINIITDGKLATTIIQQKELSQKQVDELTNYLGAYSTYGGNKAFCFDPHLGIVFYKDNKVVAHISICLECNYLSSSIKIHAIELNKIKIGDHFEYPAEGFSKLGRQKINSLCKQLNFRHCVDKLNTSFDE